MKLETEHGADPAYVARLPATVSFLLGKGLLSKAFRAAATHLLSPLSPTPKISHSLDGWACKNTALAAGTFMLAAQAHGLATAPMEGFDERRVGFLLRIPADRFSIPLVVTTGYSADEAEDKMKPRPRLPLSEVAFSDSFSTPFL
jgi:nitroreductase